LNKKLNKELRRGVGGGEKIGGQKVKEGMIEGTY